MELKANSQNQLLATLEGMGSVKESFTWKIPKDLFTSGVAQQEFKISTTEKPLQYGFTYALRARSTKPARIKNCEISMKFSRNT
ncbi:hypothetical protein EBQ74_04560 [bacterium]|nr:hypothetical protein [bacterium]